MTQTARPGEIALPFDPGENPDAGVSFIGRLRSPWARGDCPKNLREARARGGRFAAEIDAPWRAGLAGLTPGDAVVLLYWMHDARRDLIVQAPSNRDSPVGVFALRSPARPNPVAMAVARILSLDAGTGVLHLDAVDAFDGTPLLDIKPWLPTVDIPPDA
jgi:tRNA-Thr(GGU) m(6)t(6)A37 methyltransferase TsaA